MDEKIKFTDDEIMDKANEWVKEHIKKGKMLKRVSVFAAFYEGAIWMQKEMGNSKTL